MERSRQPFRLPWMSHHVRKRRRLNPLYSTPLPPSSNSLSSSSTNIVLIHRSSIPSFIIHCLPFIFHHPSPATFFYHHHLPSLAPSVLHSSFTEKKIEQIIEQIIEKKELIPNKELIPKKRTHTADGIYTQQDAVFLHCCSCLLSTFILGCPPNKT